MHARTGARRSNQRTKESLLPPLCIPRSKDLPRCLYHRFHHILLLSHHLPHDRLQPHCKPVLVRTLMYAVCVLCESVCVSLCLCVYIMPCLMLLDVCMCIPRVHPLCVCCTVVHATYSYVDVVYVSMCCMCRRHGKVAC